ncbi:MAG TPA: hypothetical protein VFZ65_15975 [Planctomycetota bacterium]|nr:hypothetical protein [Planctomycetota bacterium]
MTATARALLCVASCCACTAPVSAPPLPHLARTIPMPGIAGAGGGRLDHLDYDRTTGRLFLAAVGCDSLEVIDLRAGRHLQRIAELPEPQGVAVVPRAGAAARVFVGCGGDGSVRAYDAASLAALGSVFAGDDADNVHWDPRTARVWVGCGGARGGAVVAIDPETMAVVAHTELPAHAEGFRLDEASARMFVNVPGADGGAAVLLADRERGAVEATCRLRGAAANFPLCHVAALHAVLLVCRDPSVLLVLDDRTGDELARVSCVADGDDVFFDEATGNVLVIGGEGGLEVFAMPARGTLQRVGVVPLPPRARTGLLVSERRALYVAVPRQQDGTDAAVLEFLLDPGASAR